MSLLLFPCYHHLFGVSFMNRSFLYFGHLKMSPDLNKNKSTVSIFTMFHYIPFLNLKKYNVESAKKKKILNKKTQDHPYEEIVTPLLLFTHLSVSLGEVILSSVSIFFVLLCSVIFFSMFFPIGKTEVTSH
jgi:hypothetical protein